jgi:hypothetical protein
MDVFMWKREEKSIPVCTLKELFDVLVSISQQNIDNEMQKNVGSKKKVIADWLEKNHPKCFELISHVLLENYSSQQLREQLIRDLRKMLSKMPLKT